MAWLDYIKEFFPDVTEQQADFILWEKTAFPMGGKEMVEKQIRELAEKTNGDLSRINEV